MFEPDRPQPRQLQRRRAARLGELLTEPGGIPGDALVPIAVAVGLGYRPHADAAEWLGAMGAFGALAIALTWLTVAFGLFARTPAGANSLSLIVVLLDMIVLSSRIDERGRPRWPWEKRD